VELVPTLACDVAHINVSFEMDEKPKEGADETSAFGWHFDSVPFVTVIMLSDCSNMVGGETAIRTSSGEVVKVRGPTMVSPALPMLFYHAEIQTGNRRGHAGKIY
jgi:hypothetical protein